MSFINHRAEILPAPMSVSSRLPQARELLGAYDANSESRVVDMLEWLLLVTTAGIMCLLIGAIAAGAI